MARRHALAAASVLLVACGATDTSVPDPGELATSAEAELDGIATEADAVLDEAPPPVAPPFQGMFKVGKIVHGRPFVVPHLASVHLLARARWEDSRGCRGRRFEISLHRDGSHVEVGQTKVYPTDGNQGAASWQNVDAGVYHFDLAVNPPDKPKCTLIGSVNVTL